MSIVGVRDNMGIGVQVFQVFSELACDPRNDLLIESFYLSVPFWVVCGPCKMLCLESRADVFEYIRYELHPIIGVYIIRCTVPKNPIIDELFRYFEVCDRSCQRLTRQLRE